MERHIPDLYALGPDLLQQLRGEVEPRREARRAPPGAILGLIPPRSGSSSLDVAQGHLAQPLQRLQKDALVVEADQAAALLQLLHDLGGQLPVAEGQSGALAELPARADREHSRTLSPLSFSSSTSQMPPPGSRCPTRRAGSTRELFKIRQSPGVEMVVSRGAAHPIQGHQAGGVPLLNGGLGDQLFATRTYRRQAL